MSQGLDLPHIGNVEIDRSGRLRRLLCRPIPLPFSKAGTTRGISCLNLELEGGTSAGVGW